MPTAFVALNKVFGMRRLLKVDCIQRRRQDRILQRFWINRHIQHAFEFPWKTLYAAERSTYDTFIQAIRGRYLNDIQVTDPWETGTPTYTCRVDEDESVLEEISQGRWSGRLRLVEISGFKAIKAAVTAFPVLETGAVTTFPYSMRRHYATVLKAQQDDTEKRYEELGDASGIQRWSVGGDRISDTDAHLLINAWEGNGGPYESMTFTEPQTSAPYTVHFVETQLEHRLISYNCNSVRLTLEELKAA